MINIKKVQEIIGKEYSDIADSVNNNLKKGNATTNEFVYEQIKFWCNSNPEKIIEQVKKYIGKDPSNKKLVDLIISNLPAQPLQSASAIFHSEIEDRSEEPMQDKVVESEGITVTIICRNKEAFDCLGDTTRILGSTANMCSAFSKAVRFFAEKVKTGVIDAKDFLSLKEIRVIDGNMPNQAIVIEQPFVYSLLPSQMEMKFSPPPEAIYKMESKVVVKVNIEKDFKQVPLDEEKVAKDRRLYSSFIKFMSYFAKINYIYVTRDEIEKAIEEAKKKFIGIEELADRIRPDLNGFSSEFFDLPKGFLFYGPPGTGKSAIIKYILDRLPFQYLCPALAAGDFNKGFVGDSERMINQFARRAQTVPWELCALLVDEIDALAPNRMSGSTQGHTIDTLSVLLSVLDGAKKTDNLKIFATTNKFEQMDEAFCRRLDKKIFVGKPDFLAREKWIGEMIEKITSPEKKKFIEGLITPVRRQQIVVSTLNFSCDALKKLFSRIFEDMICARKKFDADQLISIALRDVCISERVYFGQHRLPELISNLPEFNKQDKFRYLEDFYTRPQSMMGLDTLTCPTHRILIDLNEDPRYQIQMEIFNRNPISEELQNLLAAAPDMYKSNPAEGLEILRDAFGSSVSLPMMEESNEVLLETLNDAVRKLQKRAYGLSMLATTEVKTGLESVDKEVYPLLINFALENYLGTVTLVDSHYLIRNESSDDSKAEVQIAYAVDEAKKHPSGMVIFNLDSIAGISKEYSGLHRDARKDASAVEETKGMGGPSLHYSMLRPKAFHQALTQFADNKEISGKSNIWLVAISEHDILTQHLKERARWAPTVRDAEREGIEMRKNIQHTCKRCLYNYTEGENDKNACGKHSSEWLYNTLELEVLRNAELRNPNPNLTTVMSRIKKYSLAEVRVLIKNGTYFATQFQWSCCNGPTFGKGEIPAPHMPE